MVRPVLSCPVFPVLFFFNFFSFFRSALYHGHCLKIRGHGCTYMLIFPQIFPIQKLKSKIVISLYYCHRFCHKYLEKNLRCKKTRLCQSNSYCLRCRGQTVRIQAVNILQEKQPAMHSPVSTMSRRQKLQRVCRDAGSQIVRGCTSTTGVKGSHPKPITGRLSSDREQVRHVKGLTLTEDGTSRWRVVTSEPRMVNDRL